MVLAMAAFIVSDTMLKIARQELAAGQILAVRGVFAIVMLLAGLAFAGRLAILRQTLEPILLLRALIEGGVAVLFVIAIGAMALADLTSVLMVTPLLIVAVSALFLGEKVGWRRWMAILCGFAGVVLVLQPGGHAVPLWAGLAAAGSATLVVMRDLLTRFIPPSIPSLAVTATTTFGTTLYGFAVMFAGPGLQPASLSTTLALLVAAVFVLIGNYGIIAAHRDVELSVVSPFRFAIIVFALTIGIVVFGEWPTPLAVLGMVMIVGSGIYAAHRERVRRQEAERAMKGDERP